MAFDKLKDEIGVLVAALDDKPPVDKLELYQTIHGKLQELKAFNMPLPADLVELETVLREELERARFQSK